MVVLLKIVMVMVLLFGKTTMVSKTSFLPLKPRSESGSGVFSPLSHYQLLYKIGMEVARYIKKD